MTHLSVLFRIFLLLATFKEALCSHLALLPNTSTIAKSTGETLAVTCITNHPGENHLQWRSKKGIISTHHTHRLHVQETYFGNKKGLALMFGSTEAGDGGSYHCENAKDPTQSVSFKLTIYERITFKDTPKEQNFTNGETAVTVRCEASGNPTPVIKWRRQEGFLTTTLKYQPVADGLVIRNVTFKDAGLYSCLAFIELFMESTNIQVNVLYMPQWNSTEVPNVLFRTKDKTAVLSCAAHAYPKPTFRWFYRDTLLESEASQVTALEDGMYRCEAYNDLGAIARNFTVIEGYLPGRPGKPKAKNTSVDTVTLDFVPPKPSKHHNITGYNIELRDKNSSHQKHVKLSDGPPFIIKDLRPGTTYVIRLKAENELGFGDYSLEVEAKTSKASALFKFSFVISLSVVFGYLF